MNIQNIEKLHSNIAEAVKWVERNDISPNERREALRKLKKARRDSRTILRSIRERPAAATYGESQMGKSYLIEHLLSVDGERFKITDPGTGIEYDYLVEINPFGGGGESTGIVSRFTIENVSDHREFPIKIKLLSVKDIVLFLMDSYFQDISNHDYVPDIESINAKIKQVCLHHVQQDYSQAYLDEDDILEIYDYVNEHFQTGNIIINHFKRSEFWNEVSGRIKHFQPESWVHIFSLIWGENQYFNAQFSQLIEELKNLNFASAVFTNFETILNKYGTLLHVNRIKELNGSPVTEDCQTIGDYKEHCSIMYFSNGAAIQKTIKKSVLSAISKELVIKVDERLLNSKSFLKQTDLLDFPGARSRLGRNESDITKLNISETILRGKVAYIFNKYSAERLITLLLIVHKNFMRSVAYLPILINQWVQNYIGKDAAARTYTLSNTKVPPLFFIFTFFNAELEFKNINDRRDNLESRWILRFQTVLENELAEINEYDWLKSWTLKQPLFSNIYFLRSYDYSNKTFRGYNINKTETGYADLESTVFSSMEDFQSELKSSFLNFEFVKKHFPNPSEIWDEAATLNKNGSAYIIRSLNATDSEETRQRSYAASIHQIRADVSNAIMPFFEDGDADAIINREVTKVLDLQGYLNALISDRNDPFFFGDFISSMMVSEADVFNFFKEKFEDLNTTRAASVDRYLYFRTRSPRLMKAQSREEKLNILKEDYKKDSVEETVKYFENMGMDLDVLFDMNRHTIKSASIQLAEDLKNYWFVKHLGIREDERGNLIAAELPGKFKKIMDYGLGEDYLRMILQNLALRFNRMGIENDISDDLSEFVDNERAPNILELISDNGRIRINNFINNFGWEKYNEDAKANLARIVQSQNRDTLTLPRIPEVSHPNEDALTESLTAMQQYANAAPMDQITNLDSIPIVANTKRWIDFMQMSFLVDCETGKRDPEQNRLLGEIISGIRINETGSLN